MSSLIIRFPYTQIAERRDEWGQIVTDIENYIGSDGDLACESFDDDFWCVIFQCRDDIDFVLMIDNFVIWLREYGIPVGTTLSTYYQDKEGSWHSASILVGSI